MWLSATPRVMHLDFKKWVVWICYLNVITSAWKTQHMFFIHPSQVLQFLYLTNRFQTLKMVQLVLRSMLLIDRLVALRKLVSFFLVSQFIAHPNCQEYTLARWYFGNQKWRQMSTLRFTLLSMLVSMLYPVLSIIYILLPWDKFSRMVKTP